LTDGLIDTFSCHEPPNRLAALANGRMEGVSV